MPRVEVNPVRMQHVGDEFAATLDGSTHEIGLLLEALTDARTYSHGSGEA